MAATPGETMAMKLELQDGKAFEGFSFGANRSIAGELVFQTGMVGYPESLTDPSYRGQILVITYPMVGNYGVPDRSVRDPLLNDLPAYFESDEAHIAGLVVLSYSGENWSNHLANSSLGDWLKEQNIPAMCGADTRELTKVIRQEGSMLGRMLIEAQTNGHATNGDAVTANGTGRTIVYEEIPWVNPNEKNLVAEGEATQMHPQLASRF